MWIQGGGRGNGRWRKTSRMICTSICTPSLVHAQGIALCHSTRALYGIPAGSAVAQHVRAAVTGRQGDMKWQGNRLTKVQSKSAQSPPRQTLPAFINHTQSSLYRLVFFMKTSEAAVMCVFCSVLMTNECVVLW